MWNFVAGAFCGSVISIALLAWFLHAVEVSKHTEDEQPATIPATIQVRKYPRYRTYTSVDPSSEDTDISVNRTCTYRHAASNQRTDEANALSADEIKTATFVRWCIVTRGLYSED